VRSCGTSTAVSLPCMFSDLGQARYSDGAARARETLLDVLAHAGLQALWIDNNTGSKHIAWQQEEDFLAESQDARRCNAAGCFDEILVDELRRRLAAGAPPALIVLHQKGSHGPSYFERYPPAFRRFTPTCESNELEDCTREQIVNTYDNTILYTDHVLGEVMDALRAHQGDLDSAMLYIADHGESTGEHGFFLHGAPDFMAPPEQTRIPMLLWLSTGFGADTGLDRACIAEHATRPYSHDHLFHSVLGLLDVQTRDYDPRLDLAQGCHRGGGGSQWVRTAQAR
jgi:lipid A ethanolaminephosphotransferase